MTVDEGNYVYNMKPNCQGKYWSTVSFATINCVLSSVTLTQACATCPINSPYGRLTNNSRGHHGHPWSPRIYMGAKEQAQPQQMHNGTNSLSQWANKFNPKRKQGTFSRQRRTARISLFNKFKRKFATKILQHNKRIQNIWSPWHVDFTQLKNSLGWGLVKSPKTKQKKIEKLAAWGEVKSSNTQACLLASLNPANVSVNTCEGKRFQNFELTKTGILKVNNQILALNLMYQTQSFCLTLNSKGEVTSILCRLDQQLARNLWDYNPKTKRITACGLCLALGVCISAVPSAPTIRMDKYDRDRRTQEWSIEFCQDSCGKIVRDEAFTTIQSKSSPSIKQVDTPATFSDDGTDDPISLLVEHHHYTEGRAIVRENILSDELHLINCAVLELKIVSDNLSCTNKRIIRSSPFANIPKASGARKCNGCTSMKRRKNKRHWVLDALWRGAQVPQQNHRPWRVQATPFC